MNNAKCSISRRAAPDVSYRLPLLGARIHQGLLPREEGRGACTQSNVMTSRNYRQNVVAENVGAFPLSNPNEVFEKRTPRGMLRAMHKGFPALFALVLAASCVLAGCLGRQGRSGIPSSWENKEGVPPVGDQVGAGSCYAWAAAYYYLTHLQWRDYGWDVTDPAHQCSPAFVYNLTNGGVNEGAWKGENPRADAFRVFETLGCATMADMPYTYLDFRAFPSVTECASGQGPRAG
jgi:hypothetical protein